MASTKTYAVACWACTLSILALTGAACTSDGPGAGAVSGTEENAPEWSPPSAEASQPDPTDTQNALERGAEAAESANSGASDPSRIDPSLLAERMAEMSQVERAEMVTARESGSLSSSPARRRPAGALTPVSPYLPAPRMDRSLDDLLQLMAQLQQGFPAAPGGMGIDPAMFNMGGSDFGQTLSILEAMATIAAPNDPLLQDVSQVLGGLRVFADSLPADGQGLDPGASMNGLLQMMAPELAQDPVMLDNMALMSAMAGAGDAESFSQSLMAYVDRLGAGLPAYQRDALNRVIEGSLQGGSEAQAISGLLSFAIGSMTSDLPADQQAQITQLTDLFLNNDMVGLSGLLAGQDALLTPQDMQMPTRIIGQGTAAGACAQLASCCADIHAIAAHGGDVNGGLGIMGVSCETVVAMASDEGCQSVGSELQRGIEALGASIASCY